MIMRRDEYEKSRVGGHVHLNTNDSFGCRGSEGSEVSLSCGWLDVLGYHRMILS